MCGIVTFWGQFDGVSHVLEALHLLQYRAPDSSGVATLRAGGTFALRRSVGTPRRLLELLAADPLYSVPTVDDEAVASLLSRQGLDLTPGDLRSCAGHRAAALYRANPLYTGLGDRGAPAPPPGCPETLSRQMHQVLAAGNGCASPDFDPDPVTHTQRLLGAHIAARLPLDPTLREILNTALLARVPAGSYAGWAEAWAEEIATRVPGQAFAVAARHFQENFPGLAPLLPDAAWERVGGLTARALGQMVMGHGRWAMVGAVTADNAHPFLDRSCTRAVCENGSHNARVMLGLRADQEAWWHDHGVPAGTPAHRSQNTTEVIAYEWERIRAQLAAGTPPPDSAAFLDALDDWEIGNEEERALRLALWRVREGNAHACTFYSRHRPGSLYVSSHHKPIAIAIRTIPVEGAPPRREVMVASDINAALMLWPGTEVDSAAAELRRLETEARTGRRDPATVEAEIAAILARFTVDVIFLDAHLFQGEELLAQVENRVEDGAIQPRITVTRYDGTPVAVRPRRLRLNPAMVGKGSYDTYTESHIAEIPDVVDRIVAAYVRDGVIHLEGAGEGDEVQWPGLNLDRLQQRFGQDLAHLRRLLLVGEGSSWRDAQTAAPLFRDLLPGVPVNVYRPVELLNLGQALDPAHDLVVEISWSGTTDSLLKLDAWLAESDLLRVAITGRAQSDLGRRTGNSGGTLDVHSGVEVSVATVKGFEAILMTLALLALQLALLRGPGADGETAVSAITTLLDELSLIIPRHLRDLVENQARRDEIRRVATRCRHYNKVVVVGNSPLDLEAELKIEELAQVVALPLDFHDSSLRPLMERSALVEKDAARVLFIFNVTTPAAHAEARPLIAYLESLGVYCIIHTTPHEQVPEWQALGNTAVFITPQVSPRLQPLLDAPFFFDLAVALAYARGLAPADIDSPRNLAKSVTTTGAERRDTVEARPELANPSLAQFARDPAAGAAWDPRAGTPTRAAFRATVALRAALSVIGEPLPARLKLNGGPGPEGEARPRDRHLLLITDTEATENAGLMAASTWHELLGIDLAVYRRFISALPEVPPDTAWLRLVRAGVILSLRDAHTIALPADMSPLQLELLGAVYLTGLAIRLARQRGQTVDDWEAGLARLPLLVADLLADQDLVARLQTTLAPYLDAGYDKFQVIGGGQDYAAATSIARSLRLRGYLAEELYTDSAWHGPLATVGGGDAEHDTLILILATDPLFQAAALVDTQVYRTRNAPVFLLVPAGNENHPAVRGVEATAVIPLPPVPRPFLPVVNATFGEVLGRVVEAA